MAVGSLGILGSVKRSYKFPITVLLGIAEHNCGGIYFFDAEAEEIQMGRKRKDLLLRELEKNCTDITGSYLTAPYGKGMRLLAVYEEPVQKIEISFSPEVVRKGCWF